MRHFATLYKANKFVKELNNSGNFTQKRYKKKKGHKNRTKKPYVVCSYIGWLNLY